MDEGEVVVGDQDALKHIDPKVVRVPDTLTDMVMRRVDRLSAEHKKVLQVASVIGDPFGLELLRAVMGIEEGALVDVVEGLLSSSLVSEDIKGDGDLFHFNQEMVRSVIYTGLSMGRKRLLHRQVGTSIENLTTKRSPQVIYTLANHFAIGHVPDKAIQYNTLAGDKASVSYAAEEAISFYIQAMDFLDHMPGGEEIENRRIVLLLKIGDLYRLLGKWEKGLEYYTQMIAIAKAIDDDGMVGLALRKMGHLENYRGNWDDAERLLMEGLRIAKECQDEIGIADGERGLGTVGWRKGQYQQAVMHLIDSLAISEGVNDHYMLGLSYTELGNIYNDQGSFDKADDNYQKALGYFEPLDELLAIARIYNNIGVIWGRRGDWERSLKYIQKAIGIYERSGSPQFIGPSLCNLSVCLSKLGRLKESKQVLDRLGALLADSENKIVKAAFELEYGIFYRFSEDWKRAEERICRAIDMFKELDMPNMQAVGYEELAKMFAVKGVQDKARQNLQKAREFHVRTGSMVNIENIDELLKELLSGNPLPL